MLILATPVVTFHLASRKVQAFKSENDAPDLQRQKGVGLVSRLFFCLEQHAKAPFGHRAFGT